MDLNYINIGDYICDRSKLLGEGSYGKVYKGWHKYEKYQVAVKEIQTINYDVKSLEQEKEILRVSKHPNLVNLFLSVHQGGYGYLVTEFCNYGNLDDFMRLRQTLDIETIQHFFKQIASGLEAMHKAKFNDGIRIIHRDLKPENILLTVPKNENSLRISDITVKIADFGIGRFLLPNELATTFIGTVKYMAPEIWLEIPYDEKVDLWSIGVILYQCVVGSITFLDKMIYENEIKALYEEGNDLDLEIPPGASKQFIDLLTRLLQIDPRKRSTLDEFVHHPFFKLDKGTILIPPCSKNSQTSSETKTLTSAIESLSIVPNNNPKIHAIQKNKQEDVTYKLNDNAEISSFTSRIRIWNNFASGNKPQAAALQPKVNHKLKPQQKNVEINQEMPKNAQGIEILKKTKAFWQCKADGKIFWMLANSVPNDDALIAPIKDSVKIVENTCEDDEKVVNKHHEEKSHHKKLQNANIGDFTIEANHKNPAEHVLCIKSVDGIQDIKVEKNSFTLYKVAGQYFESIDDVIRYYNSNPIIQSGWNNSLKLCLGKKID